MELTPLAALMMGFLGGLHCFGMCGSIASVLSVSLPGHVREKPTGLISYLTAYSAGRLFSYSVAGALSGWFGYQVFLLISPQSAFRIVQIAASLTLIVVGLYLANWLPGLSYIEKIGVPLWSKLEPLGRKLLPVKNLWQAVMYGVIWGWLPCGLVYTALVMASVAGSASQGALTMLAFGVGTLPAILASGAFAERVLRYAHNKKFRVISGLILILVALGSLFLSQFFHQLTPMGDMHH